MMQGIGPRRPRVVRGRKAVELSLVDAATRLFAARNPSSVTVREITAEAGVNHGLVHHYFGSKQGLLLAVLENLSARAAEPEARRAGLAPGSPLARYVLVASRVLLDGKGAIAGEQRAELFAQLQRLFRTALGTRAAEQEPSPATSGGGRDGNSAALVGVPEARPFLDLPAAQAIALVMGWLVFEPFLLEGALAREQSELERIRAALQESAAALGSRST